MSTKPDSSAPTLLADRAMRTNTNTFVGTPKTIANLHIPQAAIDLVMTMFSLGYSPDAVVEAVYQILLKTYDPAKAKAMAEKLVSDTLKSMDGLKPLFDAQISNGKDPQKIMGFITEFREKYGDDPLLMDQLNNYLMELSYDDYEAMGVVKPGMTSKEATDAIVKFLVDAGMDPDEAKAVAEKKMAAKNVDNAKAEMTSIADLAINAKSRNEGSVQDAKDELKAELIALGYSEEDAEILSKILINNLVQGNDVISEDAALIIYNHASGTALTEIPAGFEKSIEKVNNYSNKIIYHLIQIGLWVKDNQVMKEQLALESISPVVGALSFGAGVASVIQSKLDAITAPSSNGGPSVHDMAYQDAVNYWGTMLDAVGPEALRDILMNVYGLTAEEADTFIAFLVTISSGNFGYTGTVPDSIKKIINNEGPGRVVLYSTVGMYNTLIDKYTELLDSFFISLRSELEALGVPTAVLDQYTDAELLDPEVQKKIAAESGVALNVIVATVNSAEVMLRFSMGTIEHESYVASLQQQQLENLNLFNAGLITKEEYDTRSTDITTKINEIVSISANTQDMLKKIFDLFVQILSKHP